LSFRLKKMHEFEQQLNAYCRQIDARLAECFTERSLPQDRLFESMRYSLLSGGKRIRPALVLEFCRVCGGSVEAALPLAAGVEMIHTYSLIHDDLPCMDNDEFRRGRPTNHRAFGEAPALLAGDALLTAAFTAVSGAKLPAEAVVHAVQVLSVAAGPYGMVGGQMMDLEGEDRALSAEYITEIHRHKTGDMIEAACLLGVIAAGGTEEQERAAASYARSLGLAFQIRDDMLDVIGDEAKTGRPAGSDSANGKSTFASLYGIASCAEMVRAETEKAKQALSAFAEPQFLESLADYLAEREN
jgi:geranylgeranyl diphosphate synthase type II